MNPHQQIPLCCPCGEPSLYRRGLCEPCYHRRRREQILTRDRRLCRVCHARHPLVVHHRRPSNLPAAMSPAPLMDLVLDGLSSEHSRRAYRRALGEFFSWYQSNASGEGFTRATLQRYRSYLAERNLSAASINLHLAALRKLATEAASNGLIAPETTAAILRVPGARRSGVRTGNWLTLPQAQQLLAAPDPATPKGLRDRVLLGLLVGCGLRRGELAGLDFHDVAQREGRWAIVDLVGKHGRVRTVPMPSWAKDALDRWISAAGISSGAELRRVDKGGRIGPGPLTPQGVFETVVAYARQAGLGKITPHDLRRTFAKLAHLGRATLEQIQISLGPASIQTTERYLGLRQNLHDAPCDRLGLVGWEG